MVVELEIISDTYAINQKTGKRTLIKRNDKIKKLFDLNIINVEEFVDIKTGKHMPKYSLVVCPNDVAYKVNKPFEDLKVMIQDKSIPVLGFAAKSRRYR